MDCVSEPGTPVAAVEELSGSDSETELSAEEGEGEEEQPQTLFEDEKNQAEPALHLAKVRANKALLRFKVVRPAPKLCRDRQGPVIRSLLKRIGYNLDEPNPEVLDAPGLESFQRYGGTDLGLAFPGRTGKFGVKEARVVDGFFTAKVCRRVVIVLATDATNAAQRLLAPRQVHWFTWDDLQRSVINHAVVPEHTKVKSLPPEVRGAKDIPVILASDINVRFAAWPEGTLVRIRRVPGGATAPSYYYRRVVKE